MWVGGTCVIPVVAFAGKDQNAVFFTGEAERDPRDLFASLVDHFGLGTAGVPRSIFPLPHLRDR